MHACDRRTDRRHSKTVRMLSQLHGKNHWSDLHENSIKYVSVDEAELIKCWRSLLDTREDMKIEKKLIFASKLLLLYIMQLFDVLKNARTFLNVLKLGNEYKTT